MKRNYHPKRRKHPAYKHKTLFHNALLRLLAIETKQIRDGTLKGKTFNTIDEMIAWLDSGLPDKFVLLGNRPK